MIKLQAIGHLGKDAITNNVSGKSVINFTVAHSEKYKNAQGEQVSKTTWIECAYWIASTAIAPYLKKGTQVYVEGTPEVKTFAKNDGSTGTSLNCRVFQVQLLGGGNGQQGASEGPAPKQQNQSAAANGGAPAEFTEPIDDLPF